MTRTFFEKYQENCADRVQISIEKFTQQPLDIWDLDTHLSRDKMIIEENFWYEMIEMSENLSKPKRYAQKLEMVKWVGFRLESLGGVIGISLEHDRTMQAHHFPNILYELQFILPGGGWEYSCHGRRNQQLQAQGGKCGRNRIASDIWKYPEIHIIQYFRDLVALFERVDRRQTYINTSPPHRQT